MRFVRQICAAMAAILVGPINMFGDGLDQWTRRAPSPYGTLTTRTYYAGMTYGGGQWVGVGGGGIVVHSTNGIDWVQEPTIGFRYLRSVISGGGVFVTVGDEGRIFSSSTATDWVQQPSGLGTANDLYGVAYGNGRFVAVGNYGVSIVSTNTTNWTYYAEVLGSGQTACYQIAFGAGRFVTIGDGGYIGVSTDGVSWTNPISTGVQLISVCFGNAGFVAGDFLGGIYFSEDALNWQQAVVGTDDTYGHAVGGIAFGNGMFVALSGGQILTSTNGTSWSFRTPTGFPSLARAIAFGPDSLVVAGFAGEISQSRDLSIPELSLIRTSSGTAELNLSGTVGQRYAVQRSEDLLIWNDWLVLTNSAPAITVTNLSFSGLPHLFYRALRE